MQANPTLGSLVRDCSGFQIFKASRQALQPAKILLATAGLLLTFMIGVTLDWVWVSCGWGIDNPAAIPLKVSAGSQPLGVFHALIEHEKYCLDQGLKAARKFNLAGRAGDAWWNLHQFGGARVEFTVGEGYGVLAFGVAMGQGLYWAIRQHLIFSIILFGVVLAVWSLFGGAICRICALRFARDERIAPGEALGYGRRKFTEFFTAPLIPAGIVVLIGIGITVSGWLMSLPYIGPLFGLIGGPLFGVILIGGAVLTLFLLGTIGGFSLMWPTVAVEGLDCTDAISRSFSYFYERIERTVIYAGVALVYGALVWLVIRLFAFLLIYSVHGFFSKGYPQLDHMWATPTFDRLYAPSTTADQLSGWSTGYVGLLIKTWAGLGGCVLYAYLISYYFTSSTIIYFLLRRKVDDMELDDVYTESGEDMVLPAPPPEMSAAAPATNPTAEATAGHTADEHDPGGTEASGGDGDD